MRQAFVFIALAIGNTECKANYSDRKNLCFERTRTKLEKGTDCVRRGGYNAWYTGFYFNKDDGKCVPLDHYCHVSLGREKRRINKSTRYIFTVGENTKTRCEEECVDQGYNLRENSDGCKINTYLFEDECVALADELESCHVKRRPSLAACEREARSIFKPRECHSADFEGKLKRISAASNRIVALGKVDRRGAANKPVLVNLDVRDLFSTRKEAIMYLELNELSNSNVMRCEERLDYVLVIGYLTKIERTTGNVRFRDGGYARFSSSRDDLLDKFNVIKKALQNRNS
ncbi:Oidioi.mRNA.OKI2018_I69.XSR.g16278.t1.cds [Oikopleura dioica]|uniref:Oidioi.mRNA.OKI2018_I69.XSR.g16278.t1.cds n=1 Tax=Oikopleura dioica TaxID=34765 RepID=A0ABN7SFK7_OIKDI|nr:Oidioi.mRNA.OKI2018_I69.XSR.g16278.t1.cds [Oikopleura dioica]